MATKVVSPVSGGLNYDKPKWAVAPSEWSDGRNIVFNKTGLRKMRGWAKFTSAAATGGVNHIGDYRKSNGDSFLMLHSPTKLYYLTGLSTTPTDTASTAFTGSLAKPVTSTVAQDQYIFTNQVDPPQMWSGTGKAKRLPGSFTASARVNTTAYALGDCISASSKNYVCVVAGTSASSAPTFTTTTTSDGTVTWQCLGSAGLQDGGASVVSCKCLCLYNDILVLGNVVEDSYAYPRRIRWSQLGDINRFKNEDDGSGQAGYADVTEGTDAIVGLAPLSDYLVIYKERSIQVVNYVGGDAVWSRKPALQGVGLIGPRAFVEVEGQHVFVSRNNIYSFDLVKPSPIGNNIRTEFYRLLDPAKTDSVTGYYDKKNRNVFFTFTSINSTDETNDMALLLNLDEGAWSILEMPMLAFGEWTQTNDESWDSDEGTWDSDDSTWDDSSDATTAPITLCADQNGYLHTLYGNSKDGSALSCYVTSGIIDLDDPTVLKRLSRVQFTISREGTYNLKVYVGTLNNVGDSITWNGPYDMVLDASTNPWIDVDLSSRFFCLKVGTENKDEPFELTGLIYYYTKRAET